MTQVHYRGRSISTAKGFEQLDITGAKDVEVQISTSGKVMWVNVDGLCVLRICRIENPIEVKS